MKKISKGYLILSAVLIVQLWSTGIANGKSIAFDSEVNSLAKSSKEAAVPMLGKVVQTAPNQIEISYDRDVDVSLGTKAGNYWLQDLDNSMPKGIATLGKNDNVNSGNSIKADMVKITQKDGSGKTFLLTFHQDVPKGAHYRLIICYVTIPGAPAYTGDNGKADFFGK